VLYNLAKKYLRAKRAQERDHTNKELNYARTEAHDAFIFQLDIKGIAYESRDHTIEIAQAIVARRRLFAEYRSLLSTARWFRNSYASWKKSCKSGMPQATRRDESYLLDHAKKWWDKAMAVKAAIKDEFNNV